MAIIEHGVSFSFVGYKWIRVLLLYLCPGLRIPSRNTTISNLWRIHDEEKVKVKNAMHKANSRICLTSDCWTCIDRKVFSITLDNASANDIMVNFVKAQFNLQNSLICNGSYFHVRCSAHILNLIVQEGLGVASGALEYVDYLSQNVTANGKSELDLDLEEGNFNPKFHEKLDVLAYRRDRHDRYPNLSQMACDVLSIPITTVASESIFSLGSQVLTKYRYTILPKNVELLILTQNWLHGFEELDNFYNEKFLIYFYNSSS
uniref:AC transposase n=1 Tax=Cajanus cajan TaxID=3821 RepID=A0A151QV70_CAJCA|nr:Putative AC transposase [Cajanus cajan]